MQSSNKNYKQTEIGKIPQDWVLGGLSEYIEINPTRRLPKGKSALYVGMADIQPHERKIANYISKPYKGGSKFINKDTLLARITPCLENGKTAYVDILEDDEIGFGSTEFIVFAKKNDKIDAKFTYYLSRSPKLRQVAIKSMIGSSGRQRVQTDKLGSTVFAFPEISEQKQIASILSSLDDKIELNRKMNKTLEEIGRALFRQLLVDSKKIGAKVELEDFIELNPRESLKKGEVARYIEMKDLPEQGMCVSSHVSKPYKGGSKFRNSDSLMARITPCLENGKSALVNFLEDGELAFGSTEYIVFRPKEKHYREYVYYLVRNERFRQHAIKSMVGSSGRQRVQIDAIRNYKLTRPPEDLVEKFHNLMEPIFQRIKTNALENETLSLLRDSLLPRLMSGRLRVIS